MTSETSETTSRAKCIDNGLRCEHLDITMSHEGKTYYGYCYRCKKGFKTGRESSAVIPLDMISHCEDN